MRHGSTLRKLVFASTGAFASMSAACGDESAPADQVTQAMLQVRGDAAQADIKMPDGRVFRWRRKLAVVSAEPDAEAPPTRIRAKKEEPRPMPSLEQLAEDLRPHLFVGGHEFVATEPDFESARKWLSGERPAATAASAAREVGRGDEPIRRAHVIGADDRVPLDAVRTQFPHRAVMDFRSGNCTAFMIGRTVAMTAAHCVLGEDATTINTNVKLAPAGSSQNPVAPFGTFDGVRYGVFVPGGWINGRKEEYDYAMFRFHDVPWMTPPGALVGWFGTSTDLPPTVLRVEGYPKDKGSRDLWGATGIITVIGKTYLSHHIDATGGHSGAPVFDPNDNTVYGIHVRSVNFLFDEWNEATRWTSALHNFVRTNAPEWPTN